ncbi:MAG TPA: baseplate J/gp47 family protein, partial [Candidatus Didemnitutus sp.]|nr:baseplate J/gp47 family protein [Candidatus Didemnitutus sp.]
NVGANTIQQVFAPRFLHPATGAEWALDAAEIIESVSNPLPARGGTELEATEDVRQYAPQAFRTPRRCVTPEDYAAMAATFPGVQRAAASIRWTGSWHTIFLTVDRRDGLTVDPDFEERLRGYLEPFRLAGHDLEVDGPQYVSLELDLLVCVADDYFRSDVKAALLDAFSTVQRADGSRGFFHPDNFTFGDPVELSRIYATAQKVAGVRHVEVTALRRQGSSDKTVPNEFTVGRLEIVRLENDRNFPDHGVLHLKLKGGQ